VVQYETISLALNVVHLKYCSSNRYTIKSKSLSTELYVLEGPSPAAPAAARIEPLFSASVRTKPGVDGSAAAPTNRTPITPTRASTHASTGWPIARPARRASRRRPRTATTPVSQAACHRSGGSHWRVSVGRSLTDEYSICQRAILFTARRPLDEIRHMACASARWDPAVGRCENQRMTVACLCSFYRVNVITELILAG
jgi:hypothetical protein